MFIKPTEGVLPQRPNTKKLGRRGGQDKDGDKSFSEAVEAILEDSVEFTPSKDESNNDKRHQKETKKKSTSGSSDSSANSSGGLDITA